MSNYPRFDMPTVKAPDITGSLLDLARMSTMSNESRIRDRELALREADKAKAIADTAAVDRSFAPVGLPTAASSVTVTPQEPQPQVDAPDTLPSTQFTGVEGQPGATRAPSRSEIMAQLPGHLKPLVQKQFDEADENGRKAQSSILALQKAGRDATKDINEHLAGLGYTSAQWKFDPAATDLILQHARETYKDAPEMLKQIDNIDQQIKADPSSIPTVAQSLIGQSEHYTKLMQKEGATNEIELSGIAANDPDPTKRAAAQKTLDNLAAHKRSSSQPRVLTEDERFMAAPPEEQRKILAARAALAAAGRDPEVAADRKAREQQATDLRLWSTSMSVAAQKHAEDVKAYTADILNLTKDPSDPTRKGAPEAPREMTQSFEEWQAQHPPTAPRAQPARVPTSGQPAVAAAGAPKFVKGQSVTLKNGQKVTVKEVSPDGTKFRY